MKIDEKKRDELMRELGHKESNIGTTYIRRGLELYRPGMGITKELYPALAEAYNSTPSRVERAIRHSISSAWDRSSGEAALRMFADDRDHPWPTNGEYFAVMARLCRQAEGQE